MELFEKIVPLRRGEDFKGGILKALRYEKRSQGFEPGKTLRW